MGVELGFDDASIGPKVGAGAGTGDGALLGAGYGAGVGAFVDSTRSNAPLVASLSDTQKG